MYPINDRQYLKICAEIAKIMSISLSSAKKKVEIKIAKQGSKTIEEKIQVAQDLLEICLKDEGKKFFNAAETTTNNGDLYILQ